MRVTRPRRPIVSLMSSVVLAAALAATSLPAAAQFGSEAVVCVESENRVHEGTPIQRFYKEDMELMPRIGVDIGHRSQIESTSGSKLGSYPEVWCAWSDPGDDHAVIVGYTGVIRQDPTVADARREVFSFIEGFYNTRRSTRRSTTRRPQTSRNSAMRAEANLQCREGRGSPVCSPRARRTPLLDPVGGRRGNQIRHHQSQQLTVRESGAGPHLLCPQCRKRIRQCRIIPQLPPSAARTQSTARLLFSNASRACPFCVTS